MMTVPDPHSRAVRPAAVAGTFYPADPGELRALVRRLLSEAGRDGARSRRLEEGGDADGTGAGTEESAVEAFVVPHAGYAYSGPVAATAYARVVERRGRVGRVVLVGPSHRVAFRGIASSGAGAFDTPLGAVPVDAGAVDDLQAVGVRRNDRAHRDEHALEVQLPFLLESLGPVPIVPLLTGVVSPEEVAVVLETLWDASTLVVASSDLSHYLGYAEARRRDAATAAAIEALDADGIGPGDACGLDGVRGLLLAARPRGLRARTLDLRSSGDTAGDRARVVGYGAIAFERH